jgi:two-component system chemotaxis family response regulator WspR
MSGPEADLITPLPPTSWSHHAVSVLLVDDQLMIGEAVRRALVGEPDMHFHFCNDPKLALAKARDIAPTVILQDIVMPGVNGLDLVRGYRADPAVGRTPIIVLSTHEQPTVKRDAFAAGANDYLVKLPDRIELIARIRYHSLAYRSQIERDEAYRALRDSQEQLLAANRELQRLTNVDGLTGLSNRRYFNEYIEAEWKRALRTRAPLSMLMIDVDHFKLYNDTYGHLAGDEVLKKVAGAIRDGCRRSTDLAARYGGEEFAAILPLTPASDLPLLAENLGRSVEALGLAHPASSAGPLVTISIGGATMVPQMSSMVSALIEAADKALYRAKDAGRNRAAFADP